MFEKWPEMLLHRGVWATTCARTWAGVSPGVSLPEVHLPNPKPERPLGGTPFLALPYRDGSGLVQRHVQRPLQGVSPWAVAGDLGEAPGAGQPPGAGGRLQH